MTPDEQKSLAHLLSGQDSWQRRVAKKMKKIAASGDRSLPHVRLTWFLWPACAAALAAGAISFWIYRVNHSVGHLLAMAYDRHRLTELRIPGGNPVPLWSPERGVNSGEPPELLEARAHTESALQKTPNSALAYEAMAQVDVVAMDPAGALAQLESAQRLDPHLPRIEFDLGLAYFEEAEQDGKADEYGRAAEHFTLYLKTVDERDPVALYNRALCWERSGVPELAKKDLTEALSREPDRDWRRTIETQLRGLTAPGQPQQPESSSRSGTRPPAVDADNFEDRLNTVIMGDFAHAAAENSKAVHELAELGRTHRDLWLADWMAASRRRAAPAADAMLSAAARADSEGRSEEALALAHRAAADYRAAENVPGWLRTEAEEIYAERRTGHPDTCLQHLAALAMDGGHSRYAWLTAFLMLERTSCLSQEGFFDEAREESQRALDVATLARLPALAMRARGYTAGFYTSQGMGVEAWRRNVAGLKMTTSPGAGTMRRYQFLSDLALDASLLELPETAEQLAQESAHLAEATGNRQIKAYAAELEGQDETATGNYALAAIAFERADATLASLAAGQATAVYRSDWSADRAELELAEGNGDQAMASLKAALPLIWRTKDFWIALKYWTRSARLQSLAHRESSELASAANAVACADSALSHMQAPEERRAWERKAESAWISLVDAEINFGRNEEALSEWLWFRSAPEVPGKPTPNPASFAHAAEKSAITAWPDSTVVVFVRLPHRYRAFAWSGRESEVRSTDIDIDAARLDQIARTFTMLCADPHSSRSDIDLLGRQLYGILLTPVLPQPVTELRIDAPAALSGLPFAALVDSKGRYLGSQTRIVELAAWWGMRIAPHSANGDRSGRLLLVDAPADPVHRARIPAVYDESFELASMFRAPEVISQSGVSVEAVVARLLTASVFHFAGHAVDEDGAVGLNLGETAQGKQILLTPDSLRGVRLGDCRLAFLAACSTFGAMQQRVEEPLALPEAFLRAGAADAVGTRWAVDSAASRILVLAFYSQWLKGKSAAAALQIAQAQLREQPEFSHPYYWAAYSLLEG